MASISLPRMASPTLCAHGRSGATQVSRWRTAPAVLRSILVLPCSANEVDRRHPDGPTTQTGEEPGYFLMRSVRYEKRIRGWSPYLTGRQGRFCLLAGLANYVSAVVLLFWLTLACGPP